MKSQKCIFIIPRVNTKILAQKSKLWIKMKYSKYSNNPKEVRKRIRDKKKKDMTQTKIIKCGHGPNRINNEFKFKLSKHTN